MLNAIITTSKIHHKLKPHKKLPTLIELPHNTLQAPFEPDNISHCLNLLNIAPFPDTASFKYIINYLETVIQQDSNIFNCIQDNYTNLEIKIDHLERIRQQEEDTDFLEIKLAKLQDEYFFIDKLDSYNIDELRRERYILEQKFSSHNSNDELDKKISNFLQKVQKMDYNSLYESVQNTHEDLDILGYFGFLKISNVMAEIKENLDAKNAILKVKDGVKKKICLALLEYKVISVNNFVACHDVDKNEVMMVIIDMAFFGLVTFDNVDIVELRE